MTASVLQFNSHSQNAGVSSWTVTLPSATAGSALLLDVFINDGRTISAVTDSSSNTWAAIQSVTDGVLQIRQWRAYNIAASAGTLTVTITFDSATATVGAALREVGGVALSAAVDQYAGQSQTNPGTGTNAVTSGATATLGTQPAIVLGTAARRDGTTAAAAGTGFTSDGTANAYYDNYAFRCESKRVTATTGVAATFTANGAGDDFITMVVVMDERTVAPRGARYYYGA